MKTLKEQKQEHKKERNKIYFAVVFILFSYIVCSII